MRVPLAVMVSVTRESDAPTFLTADVAMHSQHIRIQYRTKDVEGTNGEQPYPGPLAVRVLVRGGAHSNGCVGRHRNL